MKARKEFMRTLAFTCALCVALSAATPLPSFGATKNEPIQFVYSGPLGDVLQTIMAQYGRNIVFGSDVASIPVSLQIEAAGFEQLLYMLEIAANVEITKIGDKNYTVKTFNDAQKLRDIQGAEKEKVVLAEKAARDMESEKQRAFNDTMARLETMEVRLFDVKFVAVDDLEKAVQDVLGDEFKELVKIKSLSVGGARNYSSILVSAPNQRIIERVGQLIKTIDREKPMVEIEALFVEVTINDQKELGVNWSILPDAFEYKEIPDIAGTSMGDIFNGRFLGKFVRTTGGSVNAQLRQLAESGKGRVLANPRLRVMSGRKGLFSSEIQEPIMSLNGDKEVRVDYKNVGISLETLATVLDDGSIYMKVIPRSSSITGEKVLQESSAPQISERKVETEVILHPNETMIMSGLIYDRDFTTRTRVPVLSSIPLFGELFRSTSKKNERYQIFIYLRPRLVATSAGMSNDDEVGDEISEIWKRYSKMTSSGKDFVLSNDISVMSAIDAEKAEKRIQEETVVSPLSADIQSGVASPVSPAPTPEQRINPDEKVRAEEKKKIEERAGTRVRQRRYSDEEAKLRFDELVDSYKN